MPLRVANESYVRSFQYKVLNSILYTNELLCKIGYISDPNCSFCHQTTETIPGAHYPERATSLYSCNGVFTSSFIFTYAFPAKITVSGYVRIERHLIKKMAAKLRFFLVLYSVLCSSFSIIPIHLFHQMAFPQYHAFLFALSTCEVAAYLCISLSLSASLLESTFDILL